MIRRGAAARKRNTQGKHAIDYACECGHPEVVLFLEGLTER